jgi:hypothetical protein
MKSIPENMQQRLKPFMMTNVLTHSMLNNTLIRVTSILNDEGINSVLLKGQGLARNYPIPELRQCGDIDLYVGDKNVERVYELLKPIATQIDDVSSIRTTKHFHLKVGTVVIEIHRFSDVYSFSALDKIYQNYALAGLTQNLVPLDFSGIIVNTPADDFNAFYIFNHLCHHFISEGVGLRQLCDWMLFLHSHNAHLDLDYLKNVLIRMHMMKSWQVFGCILVDTLGMPMEKFPFYDSKYSLQGKKALNRILQEGNFGQNTAYAKKKDGHYFENKWFSLKCHVLRFFWMFRLFPRHAIRQLRYIVLRGLTAVWKDKFK